jgi:hypothetical protein
VKVPTLVSGNRRSQDLEKVVHRRLRHRLPIARQHGLERLDFRELRLRFDDCWRLFQHLPIAVRVAERGVRPTPDYEVDALGFAGLVVVQQQLGFLGQEWSATIDNGAALGMLVLHDDATREYPYGPAQS